MPELPEAETIAGGLRPNVEGQAVREVVIHHADVVEGPGDRFASRLRGRRIRQVGRRGKNVVLILDRELRLVVNLGMSGRLLLRSPDDTTPPPTHPAVRFSLESPPEADDGAADGPGGTHDGTELIYHDVRRFGRLRILPEEEYRSWSGSLGPEPLGRRFTARFLSRELARSISPIRSFLLDQRRIAGVGNIYANEALFRSRIHPRTPASTISSDGARRLHRAIRKVLRDAVEARGTTLRDYRTAQGGEGSYGLRLRVYGSEGEPCPRCGAEIRRIVFGNRSAFLCPRCQPELER